MTHTDLAGGRPSRRARRPRGRVWLLAVKWLCAVLSLLVLVGSGYAWATYRDFTTSIATGGDIAPANVGTKDIDGVAQNILLVGNDSRAGATPAELQALNTQDDGGSANTDTMIVLHVPADGAKATLISFPRDSYVNIPGFGMGRINSAYPDAYQAAKAQGASEDKAEGAGLLLTAKTIAQLTGLTIDHYLQINLLGFYRISNAIHGVDVCLNGAMGPAKYYGETGDGFDSGFESPTDFVYSYSGINLPKGVSHIAGTQALAFVRQRHGLPNGDLDRVARQRYFLGAVFRSIGASVLLNPFKLQSLLTAVSSSLLKDDSLNLLDLAQQMQGLASGNIIGATMVTTGPETTSDGADVLGVDPVAVKAQMKKLVAVDTPKPATTAPSTPPATVAASAVTVQVLNGSGVGGAASAASAALRTAGMNVLDPNDTTATAATTVLYPAGDEAQANTVAALVPGATVKAATSVTTVTLVLGADGLKVGGGASSTSSSPSVPASATGAPAVDNASGGLACIN